jgi:putative transposase
MTRLEDRRTLVDEIAQACTAGARLDAACALAGIDARTLQRWQAGGGPLQADRRPEAVRPGPAHALSEAERARIVAIANAPRFADMPPARIVPALADEGVYVASEASFHRVLRAHGQRSRRGRARPPRPSGPPSTHVAVAPGQVWCWDVTFLPARVQGRWFYLFLILDLYSRKIIGFEVHDTDQAEHAAHLARRTALAEGLHAGLARPVLHGDNGASLKATTVLAMLHWLGIAPSHSRPRVSDDNAYAEALFRTAKYRPDDFPSAGFADLDAARHWAQRFVHWYNHEHRHSGIRYVTPAQRHAGQDGPLLAARHALYQTAKEGNPRRWSGRIRNRAPIGAVTLNPERDSVVAAAVSEPLLSGSTGGPAFPARPGALAATARSGGDGVGLRSRSTAASRSHAQRREHGEAGEHRTFAAASTVAGLWQAQRPPADGPDHHGQDRRPRYETRAATTLTRTGPTRASSFSNQPTAAPAPTMCASATRTRSITAPSSTSSSRSAPASPAPSVARRPPRPRQNPPPPSPARSLSPPPPRPPRPPTPPSPSSASPARSAAPSPWPARSPNLPRPPPPRARRSSSAAASPPANGSSARSRTPSSARRPKAPSERRS